MTRQEESVQVTEKSLSDLVKSFRKDLGLTQEDFAKQLGKSTSSVQRYENKEDPPSADLARLALLAENRGKHEAAATFANAAMADLPPEVVELVRHLYAATLRNSAPAKAIDSAGEVVIDREESEILRYWRVAGDVGKAVIRTLIKTSKQLAESADQPRSFGKTEQKPRKH